MSIYKAFVNEYNSSNKSIHKKYFSDDKIGKSSKSLLNESKITKNH